jgi:hypothetical protein
MHWNNCKCALKKAHGTKRLSLRVNMQNGSAISLRRTKSGWMIKKPRKVSLFIGISLIKLTSVLPVAFAEIDWNDYAIVQTIEFTAADANSELPPPMSVQEVENMTLAQKRMAAMIMEDTSGDVEALRAQQAAAEAEAAAAVGGAGIANDDDAAMEESDDEDEGTQARKKREAEERERELERAKAIQASSINTAGPMKIRTDYVPKREFLSVSLVDFV